MKIFGMLMLRWRDDTPKPVVLASAFDLYSFSFFQRSSVKEFIFFFSRTLLERTTRGQRQTVDHEQYTVHIHLRTDGLACVFVADQEYPQRVAYSGMNQLLLDFHAIHRDTWPLVTKDTELPFPKLQEAIVEWQDPTKADKLTKIHADLDKTIAIVHKTIDNVLDRGTKLETLVQQSEDLGMASKEFYKRAADANRCCVLM